MDMKTIGMISLIVSGAALIFVEVKKRTTFARLEHNLGERDFDACLALLDQPITKALYSEYNRLYMSLNAYLALGDNENSTRVIERMLPLRMNKKQELALAIRASSFYVEVEDKKAAHDMLKRIEVSGSEALAKGSRETYDIFLCGSSACVDEMEGALKGARQAEELRLCQLLAIQYENREDEVRAKEHQARAEKVLEDALK